MALEYVLERVAVASVLTPVLVSFAASVEVLVTDVAYVEANALGTYFFPYQSIVLIVMLHEECVSTWDIVKRVTTLSLATVLLLFPLRIRYLLLG